MKRSVLWEMLGYVLKNADTKKNGIYLVFYCFPFHDLCLSSLTIFNNVLEKWYQHLVELVNDRVPVFSQLNKPSYYLSVARVTPSAICHGGLHPSYPGHVTGSFVSPAVLVFAVPQLDNSRFDCCLHYHKG